MDDTISQRRELLATAERLVHEFDTVPAGSVLRCFARAVRQSRRRGMDDRELTVRAETVLRERMRRRGLAAEPSAA